MKLILALMAPQATLALARPFSDISGRNLELTQLLRDDLPSQMSHPKGHIGPPHRRKTRLDKDQDLPPTWDVGDYSMMLYQLFHPDDPIQEHSIDEIPPALSRRGLHWANDHILNMLNASHFGRCEAVHEMSTPIGPRDVKGATENESQEDLKLIGRWACGDWKLDVLSEGNASGSTVNAPSTPSGAQTLSPRTTPIPYPGWNGFNVYANIHVRPTQPEAYELMSLFYRVMMLMQLEQEGKMSTPQANKFLNDMEAYEFMAPWSPEWRRITLTNEWREAMGKFMQMRGAGSPDAFAALGMLEKMIGGH